ncbi:MAG: rhomboid family intramembrane serine protease [Rhizobiales bacterium]|nr:rhomboid family intramembrane serine protease [Hyphomicrobiales bacterium]
MLNTSDSILLRRCAQRQEADVYALVLSAKGIGSTIVADPRGFSLLVEPKDAIQASYELTAYDTENQRPPQRRLVQKLAPPNLGLLLAYWLALVFFFGASARRTFSVDWLATGAAQTGLIRAGEWWRVVTALFLHGDGAHLLNNLAFGAIFILLLSQVLGPGMTALSVLLAGALGNALNAMVRMPDHNSIGASTAVFGAVGLLAAIRQDWRSGHAFRTLRDWAPLAGGVMLLAFLGFSEGRTDILAHVFGFLAGIGLGAVLVWKERSWLADRALQWKAALATVALIAASWGLALAVAGLEP